MIVRKLADQKWFGAAVLAAVLLLVFGSGPWVTRAQPPRHPHAASVTGYGARLTISIPRPVYPRDALVPVTVTLHNVSDHPVPVVTSCLRFHRGITQLDGSGRFVYPPGIPDLPADHLRLLPATERTPEGFFRTGNVRWDTGEGGRPAAPRD